MALYTHDVELKLGGKTWTLEAEFNVDGKASVNPISFPEYEVLEMSNLNTLFDLLCSILKNFGTIEGIEISEKS